MMEIKEIIAGLLDQARDKDNLAAGDPDSVFKHDADTLRAAIDLIRKLQRTETRECPDYLIKRAKQIQAKSDQYDGLDAKMRW